MRKRRWLAGPACPAIVLIAVVVLTTGSTLLHYHKDWSDQGCQLCHIRHLPSVASVQVVAQDNLFIPQHNPTYDYSPQELEAYIRGTSSRAPPF